MYIIVLPLLSCYPFDNCSYYQTTMVNTETEFDTKGGDDNDDDAFFGFPWYQTALGMGTDDFSIICQNPEKYIECFRKFIMNKNINYRKKHMALYSMRLLPIDGYAVVVSYLNSAFKQGLIKEQTLETAITQDGIWNNTVLIHFLNPKFQKVYKDILTNPRLSKKTHAYLKDFEKPDVRKELLDAFNHDRGN